MAAQVPSWFHERSKTNFPLSHTLSRQSAQMVVRLSALRTRRALLPRNIISFMFLVLISVRGWDTTQNAAQWLKSRLITEKYRMCHYCHRYSIVFFFPKHWFVLSSRYMSHEANLQCQHNLFFRASPLQYVYKCFVTKSPSWKICSPCLENEEREIVLSCIAEELPLNCFPKTSTCDSSPFLRVSFLLTELRDSIYTFFSTSNCNAYQCCIVSVPLLQVKYKAFPFIET
jgi:hypothetical protein